MIERRVVEWSIPAPARERATPWMAPRHRHRSDDEAWYVLSGHLSVRLDGETVTVGAGGSVMAAAGVAHTFADPGPDACRYLIAMTPRIAALIDALHAPRVADVATVFDRFDSELVV